MRLLLVAVAATLCLGWGHVVAASAEDGQRRLGVLQAFLPPPEEDAEELAATELAIRQHEREAERVGRLPVDTFAAGIAKDTHMKARRHARMHQVHSESGQRWGAESDVFLGEDVLEPGTEEETETPAERAARKKREQKDAQQLAHVVMDNSNWEANSVVRFLHFHKVGGTSICKLAQRHGLATKDDLHFQRNCNIKGDGPTGCGNLHRSCHEVRSLYNKHRISYATIECWFDARRDVCPNFFYATMLRDPVARIESHLAYHNTDVKHFLGPLRTGRHNVPLKSAHVSFMASTLAGHNFYIRSLGGRETFFLAQDQLGVGHLFDAMRVLRSVFHIVMILESPIKSVLLQQIPGFESAGFVAANKRNEARRHITPEQQAELRKYNALDYELFEYAKLLSTYHLHRSLDIAEDTQTALLAVEAFEDDVARRAGRAAQPRVRDPQWSP